MISRRIPCILILLAAVATAKELTVGPGKTFARIEDAVAQAKSGDVILVHAKGDGLAYIRPAVLVKVSNLTIRGVGGHVRLDGTGFNYSGAGSVPRAMFQFQRGADGCVLEGFEMFGARGESHNGAGVRINQANRVTIRSCNIHGNDMGIMSNGDGSLKISADQLIERCEIHHNGSKEEPGFNHNLYLGGASVTLRYCEVHHSITGHNVKSRAHITRVEFSYIHHSSNREFDLVEARETAFPGSDAVLVGNVIAKGDDCAGNRAVIHFGRDGGGKRVGTLRLSFNTIVTPFVSPIMQLTTSDARALLVGNLIVGKRTSLARATSGQVTGKENWLAGVVGADALDAKTNTFGKPSKTMFENAAKHDYRPTAEFAKALARANAKTPPSVQYAHPLNVIARTINRPIPGAAAATQE